VNVNLKSVVPGAVIYRAGVAAHTALALVGVLIFAVGFGWVGIRLWTSEESKKG
jgi:hypothetical protein